MTVRQRVDDRHKSIQADVLRMGGIAGDMVRLAVEAVISGDIEQARRVIEMDDEVDTLEKETLNATVLAVGLEAPVAGDLRLLVCTLGVIGEVEKIADDAVKLARRSTKLTGHFPAELKLALHQLGEEARRLFASSMRLYVEYTPELAHDIVSGDEEVDGHYVQARNRVFDLIRENPLETEHLVRTIEAFHALEHVADHAVEIARRLRMHHEP
jgi:phosphate transport system protein